MFNFQLYTAISKKSNFTFIHIMQILKQYFVYYVITLKYLFSKTFCDESYESLCN